MIKFTGLMQYGVGGKTVAFNGREPFRVEDASLRKALLATNVFRPLGGGLLYYSGKVTVTDLQGREHQVDAKGRIQALELADLPEAVRGSYL